VEEEEEEEENQEKLPPFHIIKTEGDWEGVYCWACDAWSNANPSYGHPIGKQHVKNMNWYKNEPASAMRKFKANLNK